VSNAEEAVIRDLIAARAAAVNEADIDAMMASVAGDVVVFDYI